MDRAERSVNVPSISLRREAGGQDSAGRLGNAASETLPWSFFSFFSIVLGTVLHVLSYGSFSPVLVAGMFYGMGLVILFSTPLGGVPEQRMFSQVFGNCLVMAGVAAIYANQFGDPGQLYSDPAGFYEMAIGEAKGLTLEQLQAINEGSLAIVIWSAVYDIFETMGFEKERYVGITVNVTAVALSGVIGIKIVRNLFGDDYYRFRRLTLLVSTCGLFWLFAGIHLRDSLVLLCVSTIIWTWVRLISKPDVHWRLVHVVLASLFGAAFFVYFRKEFVFLPLALLVAGMTAIAVGDLRSNRVTLYALGAIAGTISVTVGVFFASEVVQLLESGRADYLDEGADQHDAKSLGMALIVNQPLLVRLLLGTMYLYIYPIPVWSGFQLEEVYALFKSLNALFLYFLLPLLAVFASNMVTQKSIRSSALLFLVFSVLGFSLVVAGTSLETRHIGAFYVPVLVLATVPDLRIAQNRIAYKGFLALILAAVFVVHLTWMILKSGLV